MTCFTRWPRRCAILPRIAASLTLDRLALHPSILAAGVAGAARVGRRREEQRRGGHPPRFRPRVGRGDRPRCGRRGNGWPGSRRGSESGPASAPSKSASTRVFGYYIEVTRPNLSLVPVGVRPQADGRQRRALRHRSAQGGRGAHPGRRRGDRRPRAGGAGPARRAGDGRGGAPLGRPRAAWPSSTPSLALAEVAARNAWTAPLVDESDVLEIVGGRHPVVEAHLAGEPFIPNDCRLGGEAVRAN